MQAEMDGILGGSNILQNDSRFTAKSDHSNRG